MWEDGTVALNSNTLLDTRRNIAINFKKVFGFVASILNLRASQLNLTDAIRSHLLVNGRGGTTFPIRSIQNVLEDSSNELVTVLITDGELNNVNESVSYFREYLFDDNKLYIFVLGNSKSLESYRILKEIGAKIYNANSAKDFCDLVVSDLD